MSELHRQLGIVASLCVALLVLGFAHDATAADVDGVTSGGTGDGNGNGNATTTMCEMCCSPGGGDDACQFAFKGGPGVCCGSGIQDASAEKFFCCPSRANVDVGFAKCYVSVADGGYRCRQPSRGEGRFVEDHRYYRRGERRGDVDGVREGGVSLFNLVLGCVFTAFLVRGCLARGGSPSLSGAAIFLCLLLSARRTPSRHLTVSPTSLFSSPSSLLPRTVTIIARRDVKPQFGNLSSVYPVFFFFF